MPKQTDEQSAALARITADMHGTSIEAHIIDSGDLVADFRAIGHRFRFRINPQGNVAERSCVSDHIGVFSDDELVALSVLATRELDAEDIQHLDPLNDAELIAAITTAHAKLAVAIDTSRFLTDQEHDVLTRALEDYRDAVHTEIDDRSRREFLIRHLNSLERKLGTRS
jgi:hypothetical protein